MKMTITTREAYLIATALYREVRNQQQLPSEKQEWTMTQDMKALLRENFSPYVGMLAAIDRAAGRDPKNLIDATHRGGKLRPRGQSSRNRGAIGQRH